MRAGGMGLALLACLFWAQSAGAQTVLRPRADGAAALRVEANPALVPGAATWAEAWVAPWTAVDIGVNLRAEAGVTAAATLGTDDLGQRSQGTLRVHRLSVAGDRLVDGHLDVSLGRMPLVVGEGFLLADGVREAGLVGASDGAFGPGAAQTLAPFVYWDAAELVLRYAPGRAQVFVARLDRSYTEDAKSAPWLAGLVLGADVSAEGRRWQVGVTPIRVLERAADGGAATSATLSGRVGGSWAEGWSASAEAGLQRRERDGAAGRASAAYALVRRRWAYKTKQPLASAGLFFYSGDQPGTELDEGWQPLFQATADPSAYTLGEVAGRVFVPNTDVAALRVDAGLEPALGQRLTLRSFTSFTHWGTQLCQQATGSDRCVQQGDGRIYSAGRLMPVATELDARYAWRPSAAESVVLGGTLGVVKPLQAVTRPMSPEGPPVVGTSTALLVSIWAKASW